MIHGFFIVVANLYNIFRTRIFSLPHGTFCISCHYRMDKGRFYRFLDRCVLAAAAAFALFSPWVHP